MTGRNAMSRLAVLTVCLGLAALDVGCGAAASASVAKVGEAERMRSGVQGHDAQMLAPQAFAEADQALDGMWAFGNHRTDDLLIAQPSSCLERVFDVGFDAVPECGRQFKHTGRGRHLHTVPP